MANSLSLSGPDKDGSYVSLISRDFEGTEGIEAFKNVKEAFKDSIINVSTQEDFKKKNYLELDLVAIAQKRSDGRISAAPISPRVFFDKKNQEEIVKYIRII